MLPKRVNSDNSKETDKFSGTNLVEAALHWISPGKVALCTLLFARVKKVDARRRGMRYVSIQVHAYSIRFRRDCLFNLTYEVTQWRQGLERWFLVRAQEINDLA